MQLVHIYQCLCDRTRLRLLNLLQDGPLCVCHLQGILGEPQAKISKHLRYLHARGLVQSRQVGNWRIYRLPVRQSRELAANLRCLQDCATEDAVICADTARLKKWRTRQAADSACSVQRLSPQARKLAACLCP